MIIGIIGGNSFLGKHLIQSFLSLPNCSLKIWSRENNNIKDANCTYHIYDYPNSPLKFEDMLVCDSIFYCVGVGVQPRLSFSTNDLYQLNLFEPIRLINNLIDNKYTGNLFTFGSYFEIGINKKELNFNEEMLINSSNVSLNEYAVTKKMLTAFINQKVESSLSINLSHFILPNIYGETENKNRLIPYLVKQLKASEPIKVGSGTQIRQYLYIKDIADFFRKIITENTTVTGIYNLQGSEVKKIKEIINLVLNFGMKENLPIVQVNYNKINKTDSTAHYLGLDGKKATFELGWNPASKLEDIIPKYFNEINI